MHVRAVQVLYALIQLASTLGLDFFFFLPLMLPFYYTAKYTIKLFG